MRIISKQHDYYDTALGYGIDPTVVYVRKPVGYEHRSCPSDILHGRAKRVNTGHISDLIAAAIDDFVTLMHSFGIGRYTCEKIKAGRRELFMNNMGGVIFCGKLYLWLEPMCVEYGYTEKTTRAFCYNLDQVQKFFVKFGKKLPETVKSPKWNRHSKHSLTKRNLRAFFGRNLEDRHHKLVDLHSQIDAPVILFKKFAEYPEKATIWVNPILRDVQFYKAVDAFSAFQELSMFISGVLGGKTPKMIELSDEDKIAKHGYNEWSFRKEPECRKK